MRHGIRGRHMKLCWTMAMLIAGGVAFFPLGGTSLADQSDGIVEESCGEGNVNGKKVLIAYDSKHGSTALVVRQIAGVLCDCNYQVDISRGRAVEDLSPYDAVVVGSPIYWAKFLPGTQKFLKQNEQTLAGMPVALFILSTNADEETGLVKEETKTFFVDKELEKVPSIEFRGDIGLFGGAFTLRKLFPVEALSMKLSGYDDMNYRNEAVVSAWAQNLCELLSRE